MNSSPFGLIMSEPIFPVADVVATVRYYRDVLGFTEEWLWGDPPDFGGVRWGRVSVLFSQQPGRDVNVASQWHAFLVAGLDALYELHQRNGATIASPLEAKPWRLREYVVRDPNGHYLRFGARASDERATAAREPASAVVIVERLPTVDEHRMLSSAVGWTSQQPDAAVADALASARAGVVASDGARVVGTGLIFGDGVTFAYLKDIIVLPEYQRREVGSRIVQSLLAIIRRTAPAGTLVSLVTGPHLAEFYGRCGFRGPESGIYGMGLYV